MNYNSDGPRQRGSILIVAVGVLAVLALMGVTFALISRTELAGSRTLTDRQIAEFAAREGLQAAIEILSKDDPRFDDFSEAWFTPPCPTNTSGVLQPTWNRSQGNNNQPAANPYHKLVYNDGNRRACYDLNWHINEDPPGDDNADGYPGIQGIDDDGDGKIDEDINGYTAGTPGYNPGGNASDDDEDRDQRNALGLTPLVDEDGFTPDQDGRPGAPNVDDDRDGQVDEDNNMLADSDGDGFPNEDPGIPDGRSYFNRTLNRTAAMTYKDTARTRNFWDASYYNNLANDDLFSGDQMGNENQAGKSFQYVYQTNTTVAAGRVEPWIWLARVPPTSWNYILDNVNGQTQNVTSDNDGRVWEEGFGDLRDMGAGNLGLKRVDANLTGGVYTRNIANDTDDDGQTADGYYPLWTGNPVPTASAPRTNFVSYAGGRLGGNAQDDDEDSDGRYRTTGGALSSALPDLELSDGNDVEGMILDEGGKINLNAHGSLWDPAFYAANGALDATMKLDSFRVSLVRFFEAYGFTVTQARGFARAIILYRYGQDLFPGRRNVDDDSDHDVPAAGTLTDWDIYNRRRLLVRENGLDDNGNWNAVVGANTLDKGIGFPTANANVNFNVGFNDGVPNFMMGANPSQRFWEPHDRTTSQFVDEPYPLGASGTIEGIDDDREFDPVYPRGDDRPYTAIEQMIDALVWGATGGRAAAPFPTNDAWVGSRGQATIGQRLGVGYILNNSGNVAVNVNGDFDPTRLDASGNPTTPILDIGDLYAEASRVFSIVREDISVSVADHDTGKVNINVDLWHSDQMDNDNNGRIDIPRSQNGWRRADQSNAINGIVVSQNATDSSLSVTRTFSNPPYPARVQQGEYDPPTSWIGGANPPEEDTRPLNGAEKVARLKRAFRRAFGAGRITGGLEYSNAGYVDTIALRLGSNQYFFPAMRCAPTDQSSGDGVYVPPVPESDPSFQPLGIARPYTLVGQPASYDATDTTTDPVATLGRILRDQMWANIVDFQDQDNNASNYTFPVPAMLVTSYPNLETALNWPDYQQRLQTGNVDIFGVEGVHLNEVMVAPEIHGSDRSKTRTVPTSEVTVDASYTAAEDPPRFLPALADPLSLEAKWEPGATPNEFILNVRAPNPATNPPPVTPVDAKVTGQWRIKGVPRGAYVVMAYGESYDVGATGTEPDGFPKGASLAVSFPATDMGSSLPGQRNGVVLLTPTGLDYPTATGFHNLTVGDRNFRRFHVPVKDANTGTVNLTDESAGVDNIYGFVTYPDNTIPSIGKPLPRGGRKSMAIRVDADPNVGFVIRVRGISRWDPAGGVANKFAKFYSLRFVCPYAELVNIGKKPIPLALSPGGLLAFKLVMRTPTPSLVDVNNYFLYDDRSGRPLRPGFWLGNDPKTTQNETALFYDVKAGAQRATTFIPPATADGMFPTNFGYYVVALSEAAYCGTFGAGAVSDYYAATPGYVISNVGWGRVGEEDYPVQFMEFPSNFTTTPPSPIREIDQLFGLWNRDQGTTSNPVTVWGRSEIWGPTIPGRAQPLQFQVAGGEIDLWAGASSMNFTSRQVAAITTGDKASAATDRYDYCAIEKTAPVVPNAGHANASMKRFMPVNASDPQARAGMNAAWLQIDPDFNSTKANLFQRQAASYDMSQNLWWRSSQRNLWRPDPASTTNDPPDVETGRRRLRNWNKNYMYFYDAGNVFGRKYLYPGHVDDMASAPAWFRDLPAGTRRPGNQNDHHWMDHVELRMAIDNRTVPVVLDNAFPSVGWLAFVHSPMGPWKNMAPILPEERVGENDVARLFVENPANGQNRGPCYYDDNILTRLIGLSGGLTATYAAGTLNTDYSFRPSPFTTWVLNTTIPNQRNALWTARTNFAAPLYLRPTVFPRPQTASTTNYAWVERTPDWREIATVWPHGRARAKININTASMPVLAAVFPTSMAADIIRHRPYRDILDVCGFSGYIGLSGSGTPPAPGDNATINLETPELRRRILPTSCRYTNAVSAELNNVILPLRSDRGVAPIAPQGFGLGVNFEVLRGDPFFTRNAFYTLLKTPRQFNVSPDSDTQTLRDRVYQRDWSVRTGTTAIRNGGRADNSAYNYPINLGSGSWFNPLDFDDTGAGYLNDDLADDIAERMEWFSRYWNVLDIKSRFFTVVARGRVFNPSGQLAEARIRALVERTDIVNNLNAQPLATGLPTPGADGVTDGVKAQTSRFVTEY